MARALIVGCGCAGRALGRELIAGGWLVRGTTRDPGRATELEADGIEALVADPDRVATVLDGIDGVAVIFWLLAAAEGGAEARAALNGPRLERLLEEIVDTPVRGLAFEAGGGLSEPELLGALSILREAGRRWRIPFEVVDAERGAHELWLEGMTAAAAELVGAGPAPES